MAAAKKKVVLKYSKMSEKVNDLHGYATAGSAGIDISMGAQGVTIRPEKTEMVWTGIKVEIPKGYVGILASRSSVGIKKDLVVSQGVGVIDSDYRGQLIVPLYNRGRKAARVEFGDRIAQLLIMPVTQVEIAMVSELNETERGEGGIGSTGE